MPTKKSNYKRTAKELANDRKLIFEMYSIGSTQLEIKNAINERAGGKYTITQQQVSLDLKKAKDVALKSLEDDIKLFLLQQLGKLDRMESELWKAWEKSKEPGYEQEQIDRTGTIPHRNKKGEVTIKDYGYSHKKQKRTTRIGSMGVMDRIQWCIAERNKLLSLYSQGTSSGLPKEGDTNIQNVLVYIPDNDRGDFKGDVPKKTIDITPKR